MDEPDLRLATMVRNSAVLLVTFIFSGAVSALEPREILVIANKDVAGSIQIARYYCQKRDVPQENILALPLGTSLRDAISRGDYEKRLAEPIRKEFLTHERLGKIRCLLAVYGVPIKVGRRGVLAGQQDRLQELKGVI